MPRQSYVNGSYVRHDRASVHIEDRGYQFADGIYEVIALINGNFADEKGHLDRMERSLHELGMEMPVSREALRVIMREVVRRNRVRNAGIYIQVTRGCAPRDFKFPAKETPQSLVVCTKSFRFDGNPVIEKGAKAITVPDLRWKRRDIKTIALLPQTLAKQKAVEAGAFEAWMVDDEGYVTEGASSNAWIVTREGTLVTRYANENILKGVTRTAVFDLCEKEGISLEERAFTPQEAYDAAEAFSSSATALLSPIVEIDGHKIGDGTPGPVTRKLYAAYREYGKSLFADQVDWRA